MGLTMGTCAETGIEKRETRDRFSNSHWQRGKMAPVEKMKPLMHTVHFTSVLMAEMGRYF